jgi:hypothetical protein
MRQGQHDGVVGGETLNVDLGKGSLLSHTDKVRHDVRQWKSSLAVRSKISHRKRGMP